MQPGLNLEFARSESLNLADALRAAAEAGYRCVEPYVYSKTFLAINSHHDGIPLPFESARQHVAIHLVVFH